MSQRKSKTMTVWVGFSDGVPHVFKDNELYQDTVRRVAVYPSRRSAFKEYEDVRKYELRAVRSAPKKRP